MFRVEKAGLVGFGGASTGGKIQYYNDASTASQHILQVVISSPDTGQSAAPRQGRDDLGANVSGYGMI